MQTEKEPNELTEEPPPKNSVINNQVHTFTSDYGLLADSCHDEYEPQIYSELSKFDLRLPNICPAFGKTDNPADDDQLEIVSSNAKNQNNISLATDSNNESIDKGSYNVHSSHFFNN